MRRLPLRFELLWPHRPLLGDLSLANERAFCTRVHSIITKLDLGGIFVIESKVPQGPNGPWGCEKAGQTAPEKGSPGIWTASTRYEALAPGWIAVASARNGQASGLTSQNPSLSAHFSLRSPLHRGAVQDLKKLGTDRAPRTARHVRANPAQGPEPRV